MVTSSQKILVTGGAGFIGTHTVVQLLKGGFSVSIIDNFDNSVVEAVDRVRQVVGPQLSQNLEFTQGDLRNRDDLEKLFSKTTYAQSFASSSSSFLCFLIFQLILFGYEILKQI